MTETNNPYSDYTVYGPYTSKTEDRKVVVLYKSPEERTSMSYARYLMSMHLGRKLEPHEHVDHINNNRLDDRIENLQILSQADNNRKSTPSAEMLTLVCAFCKKTFQRSKRTVHSWAQEHKKPIEKACCSRSCGNKLHWKEKRGAFPASGLINRPL